MDLTVIIASIISAILGGGISAILTYRVSNRKQDVSEFEVLLNTYKDLADRNELANNVLEKRVKELENSRETSLKTEAVLRKEIAILKRRVTVANKRKK